MLDLAAVQAALQAQKLDGWLLYDFRGLNILARRVLGLSSDAILSRRWFYFIPASGPPRKLVHRIESGRSTLCRGQARFICAGRNWKPASVAWWPAPSVWPWNMCRATPTRMCRAWTRGPWNWCAPFGAEIVSSGDLVQLFEACWDDDQWAMHLEAAQHTRSAYDAAFAFIRDRTRNGGSVRETQVQAVILEHFRTHNLETDHPPICARRRASGDPHYAPSPASDAAIKEGDFVLIDLWAKCAKPRAVYSDLTWTCFVGKSVPPRIVEIFTIVAAARDAAIACVRDAFAQGQPLQGWQVDQAARVVIEQAGYGEFFCHRTGHSIGQETHGNGANMDGLETKEERRILPRTCFSIEPGIYLKEFGVRSEVNVFVDAGGKVHVTGGAPQTEVVAL